MKTLLLLLLAALSSSAQIEFAVTLKSPSTIYAGADVYMHLSDKGEGQYSLARVIVPAGASFSFLCGNLDCKLRPDGQITIYTGAVPAILRVRGLPVGLQTVAVETTLSLTKEKLTSTVQVKVLEKATIPAPAAVAKWEKTMRDYGKRNCNPKEDFGSFGYEGTVWFYDGARVFFNIADYTGDKSFEQCAFNIADQYADYLIRANGVIAGWKVFSKGLLMAYQRTGDSKYRQAINLLATKSNATINIHGLSDTYIRETSYAIEALIDNELAGAPRDPRLSRAVDLLLGHFDFYFRSDQYKLLQHFMLGLGSAALIEYYELTHDPRIPVTIKLFLDWSRTSGWDSVNNRMVWCPDPVGPRCESSCQKSETTLINLVAHAFAWYAHLTGDDAIRAHGDLMFAHAIDSQPWGGKQFSQYYRLSFGFVRERYGRTAAF